MPRQPKPMRVLITGGAGFAGSHLADLALAAGHEVTVTLAPGEGDDNLRHLGRQISRRRFDLKSAASVEKLISSVNPQWVFHLAAFSSVGRSFAAEKETYQINILGTLHLLEAVGQLKRLEKIIIVGSADSYGKFRPVNKTLKEDQPFAPVSPYGISKVAAESIASLHQRQRGVPVVIVRPFNHTGPRQSSVFALPSFCRQIAEIEAGRKKPTLLVGDLSVRRDLSDVRDIARGYLAAAGLGQIGEAYHLCSGRAISIRSALNQLIKMSSRSIKIKVDPARIRPVDIPVLRGDNRKAAKELGYAPRYTLKRTLADCLDYWRERVRGS